ncbi:Uncharacterised protein [uncultured archaeon]|nr:Uncharacterised protein [uncultured archaeon]
MKINKTLLFFSKLFFSFGLLLFALSFTPNFLLEFQARLVGSVLNLFSYSVVQAKTLFFNGISFEFVPECTGFTLIALLASLYYATNLKFDKRFWFYSLFLFLFNIFRIVVTLLLSQLLSFDVVHFSFYFVDSLVVFFIWKHEFDKVVSRD